MYNVCLYLVLSIQDILLVTLAHPDVVAETPTATLRVVTATKLFLIKKLEIGGNRRLCKSILFPLDHKEIIMFQIN